MAYTCICTHTPTTHVGLRSLIAGLPTVLSDICHLELNLRYRLCQPRPSGNILSLERCDPALLCQLSVFNLLQVL